MDSILERVRTTLIMAFKTFPLIMIGFIGFIAIGLGNMGLFILFVGHAIIVPAATELSHVFFKVIGNMGTIDELDYHVMSTNVALLVPGSSYDSTRINVAPSYWMSQTLFLFGYILANAVSIRSLPVDPKMDKILISNRHSKANTVIITTIFFALIASLLRYQTHAETFKGMLAAVVVGGFLGYGWYQFAALCGARATDVFGVVQQIIPSSAKDETPMTCVYAPKP